MLKKSLDFIPLICLIFLLGCGIRVPVNVYMEPVSADGQKAQVDPKSGEIRMEKDDVIITLSPFSTLDLAHFTNDPDINPYIHVGHWGKVEPLYTVFEISVENQRDSRVEINSPAILIDATGEQYASLPYDHFKDMHQPYYQRTEAYDYRSPYYSYYPYYPYYPYGGYRGLYRYPYRSYSPWLYYQPYYRTYVYGDSHAQDKNIVVRDTIFDGVKLFPGAKKRGLLIFDRVDVTARDIKIIIPEVKVYKDKKISKQNRFEFEFRQMVQKDKKSKVKGWETKK